MRVIKIKAGEEVKIIGETEEDRNNHMARFLDLLTDMGIDHSFDNCCGDTTMDQVWINIQGWELVFEFNAETGKYQDMVLEG